MCWQFTFSRSQGPTEQADIFTAKISSSSKSFTFSPTSKHANVKILVGLDASFNQLNGSGGSMKNWKMKNLKGEKTNSGLIGLQPETPMMLKTLQTATTEALTS